jgi:predicted Rossmann-fold nucleotide-binding protein
MSPASAGQDVARQLMDDGYVVVTGGAASVPEAAQ